METSKNASKVADIGSETFIMIPGTYLIEPSNEQKVVGGLVIPGSKEVRQGTLVMAGEKLEHFPVIPIGSLVFYMQTNSMEIAWQGKQYLVVSHRDIRLAVPPDKK